MEHIQPLFEIDYVKLISVLCVIIIGLNYLIPVLQNFFCNILGIETKFQKEKKEQKILLEETVQKLNELTKEHETSERELDDKLEKFYEPYRERSIEIQEEFKQSIDSMHKKDDRRDLQIEALMFGTKELLGDKIDQKYDKYIKLQGIPSDEVDEFNSIYEAYGKLKGNHNREKKYNYVNDNLLVIPVTTLYTSNNVNQGDE